MEDSSCSDNNSFEEVIVSKMMLHMRWFDDTSASNLHGGIFFNFNSRETVLTIEGLDDIIDMEIIIPPSKTCWVPNIPLCEPPVLSNNACQIISAALDNLEEEEFRHEITRHALAFAASDNGNPSRRRFSSIDVDIKVVSGSYLIAKDEIPSDDIEYEHEILTRSWFVEEDDRDYSIVTYLPCRSHVIDSCENKVEVIVRRIKLRLKFSNPSFHAVFNVRSRKTLPHDREYIGYDNNSCAEPCSVPIPLRETTLSSHIRHIICDALSKNNVDGEFHREITRKVLDFASSTGAKRNPSVCSIGVDIKVATGSYYVGGQEGELKWDDIERQHENITRSLFADEQDYYTMMSSYVKVPCGERGRHVRGIRYEAQDIMEAQTCAICLHDLLNCHAAVNVVNVLRMPCNHIFHKHCILAWLPRNNNDDSSTCPLCRSIIWLYPN